MPPHSLRPAARLALLVVLLFTPALADPPPPKPDPALRLAMLPADSITQHRLTAGGHDLAYTATAGTLKLREPSGEVAASMFYVAYTLNGAPAAHRPVSFFFNGGPGAGSAYLHLGAAGPTILQFPPGHETDGAHAVLQDNPDTWLRFSDLVFIDAVGTGYSLAAKPEDAPKNFWGVRPDANAFAKAISMWLIGNGRTVSPKYLVGESYGGLRSIKIARALQHSQNTLVNGIVMVSPLIEEQYFFRDDPMAFALTLPTFAAAELDHAHKLTPDAVNDAYRYALGPYLTAIAGPPPSGDDATKLYGSIASITGIPADVVAKERGSLQPDAHDVRSIGGRLFSLYDRTLSIADPAPEGVDNEASPDPLLEGYGRAYGNAFAGYAADRLAFKTDITYRLLDDEVDAKWDWREGDDRLATGTADLRKLLALNPTLHVMIAHGYFDLVCPFGASRWIVEHLPVGRDRVSLKLYPGGHMLYTRAASRAALASDAAALIAQ